MILSYPLVFCWQSLVLVCESDHLNKETWCSKKNTPPKLNMGVSKNRGTPKSSILIRFSIINHPFWGTPIFWKHPYGYQTWWFGKCNYIHSSKYGHVGYLSQISAGVTFTFQAPLFWGLGLWCLLQNAFLMECPNSRPSTENQGKSEATKSPSVTYFVKPPLARRFPGLYIPKME